MEQRLVKARLILVCNNQNIVFRTTERLSKLLIRSNRLSILVNVQRSFRIFYSIQRNRTRKRNQNATPFTFSRVFFHIFFDCKIVANSIRTTIRNNHRLPLPVNLETPILNEVRHNHFRLVGNGMSVFSVITNQDFQSRTFYKFRIVFRYFYKLKRFFNGRIIRQNVQNEPFLDGLLHRINVERLVAFLFVIIRTKQFKRFICRCSRKRKERLIIVLSLPKHSQNDVRSNIYFRFFNPFFFRIFLDSFI